MSKTSVLILIAVLLTSLSMNRTVYAQRPAPDVPPVIDGDDGADGLFDGCQDSLLLEPFPILRTLIDLLSQLLDLLNQADGLLGGGEGDLPSIPDDLPDIPGLPGDDLPLPDGTGDLPSRDDLPIGGDLPAIPGGVSSSDALPGGWGIGPILSVP